MRSTHGHPTTVDDPIARARGAVASTGAHLLPGPEVLAWLDLGGTGWTGFAGHWEDLRPDPYAARSGTRRLRRYGRFSVTPEGQRELEPTDDFRQPGATNPLFTDEGRHFEPLTGAFLADPVLDRLLVLLGEIAGALDDPPRWTVHVHPFRVLGAVDSRGDATPEGRHQDGVTLVSSLLVRRDNASGGTTEVVDADGREILTHALAEPGSLLVGDDRRTWHRVDPIAPVDPGSPARRDVLVITFAPGEDR